MDDTTALYIVYLVLFFCTLECNKRVIKLFNVAKYKINPITVGFEAVVYQAYTFVCLYLIIMHDSIK